jgi:tetratricopeptide (TPR) repeat protein
MKRRTLLAVAALACTTGVVLAGRRGRADASVPEAAAGPARFGELALRDTQIAVWRTALDADPRSAIALTQLAALHAQRARESGAWDDHLEAERLARASLHLRTQRNGAAAVTLASSLMSQHRFVEARAVAQALVFREPDVPQYRALLGEAALECGDYVAAEALFRRVLHARTNLSVAPRLVRWLEITGNGRDARRILDGARAAAFARRDLPSETLAWFEWRTGDQALREGRYRAADRAFRRALEIEPFDPRALAALGKLALLRGRPRDAVAWGERALAVRAEPETMGLIGDAWLALGDSSRADEFYLAMDAAGAGQPAFHRAFALRLLDRGIRVDEVLAAARAGLRERDDIYGRDLLAWALHAAGRHDEAAVEMRSALRFATRDPLLERHRVVIERAVAGGH